MPTPIWQVYEATWQASKLHDNPTQNVRMAVTFAAPSGATETVEAFWDGGYVWRARFCPNEVGHWTYSTICDVDPAFDGQDGSFECVAYEGENALYEHGDVAVSENGWHLAHADGTPFFWLGDTAWCGPVSADKQAWDAYLSDRQAKHFSVIQFVTTQWRMIYTDREGRSAFAGHSKIGINPLYFQRLDHYFDAVNAAGMVASPVLVWALGDSPGNYLLEDQRVVLAKYMVARYGAHHCLWILGGDGNYRDGRGDEWSRIGAEVFGDNPRRPATMHPQGTYWCAETFRNDGWYGFNIYQSGHGDGEDTLRWLAEGPPTTEWANEPHHPTINSEPPYEAHVAYQSKSRHTAYSVRRASYWSLLVSPTAGVTYGGGGIWGWHEEERIPADHLGAGLTPAWYDGLHLPGSADMGRLYEAFASVDWWRLRPAQDALAAQPGDDDAEKFIAAAKTDDGQTLVVYTPSGGAVSLAAGAIPPAAKARWFDPRTGAWSDAASADGDGVTVQTPSEGDYLLVAHA
jgi:hypothetical protein